MDYLEGVVNTIGHIAWPVTAVGIVVMTRKELRGVFVAIAKRIEDRNSAILITKEGLEIKAVVEAQEARLVSMQAEQDQVKSLALQQLKQPAKSNTQLIERGREDGIYSRLREMADAYMQINIQDYSERTRAKNAAAGEMAFYILSNNISKDQLVNEPHEGLLIALAESIILSADNKDAERLLKVANRATRLHVKYRILIAITKLLERDLFTSDNLVTVRAILSKYEDSADSPLKRLISNVTALVNETVHLQES